MKISEFNYELPEELIAQNPPDKRDASRMLFMDREARSLKDTSFGSFPDHLKKGDVIVLNNTKVFPARLFGESETGAKIELFLVNEVKEKIWEVLARPGRRLKPGKRLNFGGRLSAEVIEKKDDGKILVEFCSEEDFDIVLDDLGQTPLPPYIKRKAGNVDEDRARYQTVYAKYRGAIAAPTAGLHFTPEILDEIRSRGVITIEVTLHVGYGTFEPVRVNELSEHIVMAESFEIDAPVSEILNTAKADGNRIIAIGTTTTRALETCFARNGKFISGKQIADLTITPGYKFSAIDCLLTNFHLPKSSLLVLVSTFGEYDFMMDAYRHAVSERYRFYSYGDCMLII